MSLLTSIVSLWGARPEAAAPASAMQGAGTASELRPPVDIDRELIPRHWFKGPRLTKSQERAQAKEPPSFADQLKWRDWDARTGCFVLSTGRDAGILYELSPAATEGRDSNTLELMQNAFHAAVKTGLIEDAESPWIAQFFVQDEASLYPHWRQFQNYIPEKLRDTEFTKAWLQEIDAHLQQVAQPSGIFRDHDGNPWRGKERRVFVTLYRLNNKRLSAAMTSCNDAAVRFEAAFQQQGVSLRRCRGRDLVEWMMPFLNPTPDSTDGDPFAYMRNLNWPDEVAGTDLPPQWDLGERCVRSYPQHDGAGVWTFQDRHYKCITMQEFDTRLQLGHLTGERKFGESAVSTLMDKLPQGTRVVITVIALSQFLVKKHLRRLVDTAIGDGSIAAEAQRQIVIADQRMAVGEKLYPVTAVFYVAGHSHEDVQIKARKLGSLLQTEGLPPIEPKYDLFAGHTFLKHLPFGFRYEEDKAMPRRATLQYAEEIAKLLPLSGRSTGTGKPCLNFFNRGAEPLVFDPIADRLRNAHATIFGPTGSGKSAWLTNALCQIMAVHRPKMWIIDPKWPAPSFELLIQYFRSLGVTVNHVRLTPDSTIGLNPFDSAMLLLDDEAAQTSKENDDIEGGRDILGELTLLATAMITGGEKTEIDALRRQDKPIISKAIVRAAKNVRARGLPREQEHVLIEDVCNALHELADDTVSGPETQRKLHGMADAMHTFTQDDACGKLFNRAGTAFPDADVTLVEFATLGTEGYGSALDVAFMSLMQAIQTDITRRQYGDRYTMVVVDEVHVLAGRELMGRFITKAVKTFRSAGTWFWQATQNIKDMSDEMRKLLSNLEWFICLSMSKDEVADLMAVKTLTEEQQNMAMSASKEPGKYSEGVVIHERFTALFRSIMPPHALALAQTEQHERAARKRFQVETGCTELEAVFEVSRKIKESRSSIGEHKQTLWRDRQ